MESRRYLDPEDYRIFRRCRVQLRAWLRAHPAKGRIDVTSGVEFAVYPLRKDTPDTI